MLLKPTSARGKGLGNKIDPSKSSVAAAAVVLDATIALEDEVLLRILRFVGPNPDPCSLVCKRWLRIHGLLKTSVKVREWSFLTSGGLTSRFPNLTDVDLSPAWLTSPKPPSILFTHQFITIRLGTKACDPSSIEQFIEEQQLTPSGLDEGLRVLADGCPNLQRLCMIDVRRPTYNRASFRNRQPPAKAHDSDDSTPNGGKHSGPELPLMKDSSATEDLVDARNPKRSLVRNDFSHDEGLAYLAKRCSTLQELLINHCTDDSFCGISACQNLQILRLVGTVSGFYHCTFTDIGLTILAKACNRLVKLELSGCEASYDGIAAIGKCCFMLEELTLSNQGFYEGWIAALAFCSCLKTLRLESCKQIDPIPGAKEHLGHCAALQRLELVRCNLRDKAGFLALVSVCMNVKELIFQDCWGLDDDTFSLTETCRHVRLLSLEGCLLLTTAGLEAPAITWKDLHTLRVVCCNNIKDSEISSSLALVFSTLKELKWRPDTKSLLVDSLVGTGVGLVGGKFFKYGGHA